MDKKSFKKYTMTYVRNSQKYYFEKCIAFQIYLLRTNIDILKNYCNT